MVQALRRINFPVDQVQVYRMMQRDPQYAVLQAGTNDETEVALVPRDVGQDEGVRLATVFVRSGSESTEPQEDGESVREQDQTPEERITFNAPQEDGTSLYSTWNWCQLFSLRRMDMGTPETSVRTAALNSMEGVIQSEI